MFQFRAFPPYTYLIQCTVLEYCSSVLPHSEISGSALICSSPKLIAACHVLHRLLMPRHSPCALYSLTCSKESSISFRSSFRRAPNIHSITLPLSLQTESSIQFDSFGSLSRIMQAQQNCLNKIVFTLLKVPQLKFISKLRLFVAPLCCLAYLLIFPLFSFQGAIEGIPSKLNNVRDSIS